MKTLYLSMIVTISVTILLAPQRVFGQSYEDMVNALNKNSTKMTELVHNGAVLITTQALNKTEYRIGEKITVYPELINIGNKSMEIYYLWQPFFVVVKSQDGTIVWTDGPAGRPMEFSYNRNQTLEPNMPFTTKSPYPEGFSPLKLDIAGNYTILAVGDFYDDYNGTHRVFLWSKPLQITVLPEKVPEFPFTILVLIVGIASLFIFHRMKFR